MNYAAAWFALRQAMRRHQHLPQRGPRRPVWQLIGGELIWAARQLVTRPLVLAGLLGGFAAALGVLGAAAPGPILDLPWRVLAAIGAGLAVAACVRGLERVQGARDRHQPRPDEDEQALLGAAVISGGVTATTLIVWLVVWLIDWIA